MQAEDLNNALWHSTQCLFPEPSVIYSSIESMTWLQDFLHREVLIHFLLAVLKSFSGAYIFLVLGGNNSSTTLFSRGSCLTMCFLRHCIKIKCPWVNTCNLYLHVAHGQVLNKFRPIKRKRKAMLLVFHFYMLKDKCIYFRLILKYPKRQQVTLYVNNT